MSGTIEDKLRSMGIDLPSPAVPAANYLPAVRTGNQLFISGQIPMGADGIEFVGRCGADYGVEDAAKAARLCAINILAQVKAATGDLGKIVRLVKLVGFVNSTADFTDQPKVVNGASDFMVEALGDKGRHARSAVGVANLPFGVAVEVEAILEVE